MKWRSTNRFILGLLIIPLFALSCVRDTHPQCGKIIVAVKDKNYENAKDYTALSPIVDENLPIASYINNSLVVWDHILQTADYKVYRPVLNAGELTHTLDNSYFKSGVNHVSAIGNEKELANEYGAGNQSIVLHPQGSEHTDSYLGIEDIPFPTLESRTIWLNRTKGKLIIEFTNLPATVTALEVTVGKVYSTVDDGFNYAGEATVTKTFTPAAGSPNVFSVLLAPSIQPNTSPVTITITYANGHSDILETIGVTMVRNRITAIRPVYDPNKDLWTIMVFLNGEWVKVDHMKVD